MIRAHMEVEFNREKANTLVGAPTYRHRAQADYRSNLTDGFHFDLPDSMNCRSQTSGERIYGLSPWPSQLIHHGYRFLINSVAQIRGM
jgi:hypothetical protein